MKDREQLEHSGRRAGAGRKSEHRRLAGRVQAPIRGFNIILLGIQECANGPGVLTMVNIGS